MPLHILLILVVGGIAGIALALHLLGLSKAPAFSDDTARTAWLRAYPEDAVQSVHLTQDGRVARVVCDRGNGIVWQMGMDSCARLLTGAETLKVSGANTTLSLGDYAAPKVRLSLGARELSDWQKWIKPT